MPDNQQVSSSETYQVATDKVTYSGDADRNVQLTRPVHVLGAEGAKTVEPLTVDLGDGTGAVKVAVFNEAGDAIGNTNGALYTELLGHEGDNVNSNNGGLIVDGDVPHDSPDSGWPVKIGGRADSDMPSNVANGDRVNAWFHGSGGLNTLPRLPDTMGGDGWTDDTTMGQWGLTQDGHEAVHGYVFNGTTWDRMRSTQDASDGVGVLAAGIGPGFERVVTPSPLAAAFQSTSVVDIEGASTLVISIETSRTGNLYIQYSNDGTNWEIFAPVWQSGALLLGNGSGEIQNIVAGQSYYLNVAGIKQVRLYVSTGGGLSGTVAHTFRLSMAPSAMLISAGSQGLRTWDGYAEFWDPNLDAQEIAGDTAVTYHTVPHVFNGTGWDRMRGDTEGVFGQGNKAHDAPDGGNPVKIGGKAKATAPTDVADGDRVDAWFLRNGAQVVNGAYTTVGSQVLNVDEEAITIDTTGMATVVWSIADSSFIGTALTEVFDGGDWRPAAHFNGVDYSSESQFIDFAALGGAGYIEVPVAGFQQARVRISAYTSGSFTVVGTASPVKSGHLQYVSLIDSEGRGASFDGNGGLNTIPTGNVGHDIADSGAPIKIGGRASTSRTNVTAEDRVDAWFLRNGVQMVGIADAAGNLASIDSSTSLATTIYDSSGAPKVDPTNGLLVNLGANNDVSVTEITDPSAVTLGSSTYTETTSKGLAIGAVRRDADTTLVNTTNEWGPLQMDANGRLKVEAFDGGDSHTVDAPVGTPVNVQVGNGTLTAGMVDETGASAVDALAVGGGTPHDAVDSGNPLKMGMKAANALPTAVANNDRANAISDLWGRQMTTHIDPAQQLHKAFNATTSQAGTDVITPTSGKKLAITSVIVGTYGTTSGRLILWFGDNADTTYTAGTDQVLLAASFAPSTSSKPGTVFTPAVPVFCSTADRELHITTDADLSVDITIEYYEW